jgi:hypothetical protein
LFGVVVDGAVVNGRFVDAVMPLIQFRDEAELVLDRGRQTGGRREETSLDAVSDLDVDGFLFFAGVVHIAYHPSG